MKDENESMVAHAAVRSVGEEGIRLSGASPAAQRICGGLLHTTVAILPEPDWTWNGGELREATWWALHFAMTACPDLVLCSIGRSTIGDGPELHVASARELMRWLDDSDLTGQVSARPSGHAHPYSDELSVTVRGVRLFALATPSEAADAIAAGAVRVDPRPGSDNNDMPF